MFSESKPLNIVVDMLNGMLDTASSHLTPEECIDGLAITLDIQKEIDKRCKSKPVLKMAIVLSLAAAHLVTAIEDGDEILKRTKTNGNETKVSGSTKEETGEIRS